MSVVLAWDEGDEKSTGIGEQESTRKEEGRAGYTDVAATEHANDSAFRETRHERADHHASINHPLFIIFFPRQGLLPKYLCQVVLAELFTAHEERPPAILRDAIAVLHLVELSGAGGYRRYFVVWRLV